mgnify:CR=1 FL=1
MVGWYPGRPASFHCSHSSKNSVPNGSWPRSGIEARRIEKSSGARSTARTSIVGERGRQLVTGIKPLLGQLALSVIDCAIAFRPAALPLAAAHPSVAALDHALPAPFVVHHFTHPPAAHPPAVPVTDPSAAPPGQGVLASPPRARSSPGRTY